MEGIFRKPNINDDEYDIKKSPKQMLGAWQLTITHLGVGDTQYNEHRLIK